MNILDRIIAPVFPGWARRRVHNRLLMAYYEAAEPGRLHKKRTDRQSANAENSRSAVKLRIQARHLEENLDVASGALDVLVNNTVGAGIQPEPQIELAGGDPAEDLNKALIDLWDDWIYCPEVTRSVDYYSLQRLIARTWFRDGEAFAQHLTGRVPYLDHNTVVPFSLEALEPDFVPYDYDAPEKGVVQGVELNAWGMARAYHVYKQHPGDRNVFVTSGDYKRISADRILHLKMAKRLHQVRGISIFAPVLTRFDDLKEIDESERVAARVAAAMALFIKKGDPAAWDPPSKLDANGNPIPRSIEINPGMIIDDLQPGEDIGSFTSNRPNSALIPFRDSQLRSAASGLGTSYSSLSKNYDGTYSAQRQELVEQFVHYKPLATAFVYRFAAPVWENFVDAAVISGAVKVDSKVDPATLYNCSHSVPQMPWIDPYKEMQANELAMKLKLKSRTRIIRESGQKPYEVNREIDKDKKDREELGIELEDAAAAPGAPNDPDKDDAAEQSERKKKPQHNEPPAPVITTNTASARRKPRG